MHSELIHEEERQTPQTDESVAEECRQATEIIQTAMSSVDYESLLIAHDIHVSDQVMLYLKSSAALSMHRKLNQEAKSGL